MCQQGFYLSAAVNKQKVNKKRRNIEITQLQTVIALFLYCVFAVCQHYASDKINCAKVGLIGIITPKHPCWDHYTKDTAKKKKICDVNTRYFMKILTDKCRFKLFSP